MAYVLTLIFAFFTIFQPGVIFPWLAPARPLFTVALLALIAWLSTGRGGGGLQPKPLLGYFILAFVGAQILSVVQFFYLPLLTEITIKWANLALAFFLVSSLMNSEARLRRLWVVLLVGVAFLSGHAAWIYHHESLGHPQLVSGRLSSYGAYSGANDLALLMVCAWPIVYKFTDLSRNLLLKLIPVPLLFLIAYVELRTISRAGLLGLCLVMALSLLRGRSLGKLGRWAVLAPAVLIMFMVGTKILMTREDASDFSGKDESFQHRLDAWYAGSLMLRSSPIWGIGSDNFAEYSRAFGAGRTIQAHNTIVKVAAESGLIGLFAYLGMLLFAFRSIWLNWRRFGRIKPDGPERMWAEALGIALIGFCFNTQFSVKAHEWLLYYIIASTVALDRLYLQELVRFTFKIEEVSRLGDESGMKSA